MRNDKINRSILASASREWTCSDARRCQADITLKETPSDVAHNVHRAQDSIRARSRAARPGIPIAGSPTSLEPDVRLQFLESYVPQPRVESGNRPPLARYRDRVLNPT